MKQYDLNSDLGEGFGRWTMGDDAALMALVTSANIACGYHAGDAVIMDRMVQLAKPRGVAIGAHIGLPDLMGFGRIPMRIPVAEMANHAAYQLGALAAIAKVNGYRVSHANGHGAISKAIPGVMEAVVQVMAAFDPTLVIAANPASKTMLQARAAGLRCVGKMYADRAYLDDGLLAGRDLDGAVIVDAAVVRSRIVQFIEDGTVTTVTGARIPVDAQCILVHGDTPGAVTVANAVVDAVAATGAQLVPMTELAR